MPLKGGGDERVDTSNPQIIKGGSYMTRDELIKECCRCHEIKPKSEFRKYWKHDKYLCTNSDCKSCEVKRSTEYSKNHAQWRLDINKKYRQTPKGKEALKRRTINYRLNNLEKQYAWNKVQRAIRDGKINRMPCQECGNPKSDAHHQDYSKHLEVIWLCKICHVKLHQTLKNAGETEHPL